MAGLFGDEVVNQGVVCRASLAVSGMGGFAMRLARVVERGEGAHGTEGLPRRRTVLAGFECVNLRKSHLLVQPDTAIITNRCFQRTN